MAIWLEKLHSSSFDWLEVVRISQTKNQIVSYLVDGRKFIYPYCVTDNMLSSPPLTQSPARKNKTQRA